MSQPGCEQKGNVNCPMNINQAANKPEEFGKQLSSKTGIQKIEIINNEVICAG